MTSISDKFAEVKDELLMELMPFGTSSMLVLHPNMTHSLLLCQNERFKNRSSNYSPEIELKISKYLTCPTSTLVSKFSSDCFKRLGRQRPSGHKKST